MGIEDSGNGESPVPQKLRQRALTEMRESGKDLPFPGSAASNLSTAILGAEKAFITPPKSEDPSLSPEEYEKHVRRGLKGYLKVMGVSEKTAEEILSAIERYLGENPKH